MGGPHSRPKKAIVAALRRAGFSRDVIDELASQLPDEVDLDKHSALFLRYGITMETLTDRMGASP
jgi:hypothetical protein